jgi:hypothetical protein
MRRFLFSAALILVASSNVHATEALLFDGGGYKAPLPIMIMAPLPIIERLDGSFGTHWAMGEGRVLGAV